MNREEILEKSRKNKEDEGKTFVENVSRKYGVIAFILMIVVLTIFNYANSIDNDVVYILFWTFAATEAFAKYRLSKKRLYLIITIFGSIASIVNFVNYIVSVTGT